IDLAWSESSTNVTQFKIERSTDNVNFTQITTVAGGVTTYKDMGLTANATYYYRLRANNSAGDSGYSSVASAITSGIPAAPSSLTASAVSTSEIDLAWSESSTNVSLFKIERSTDNVNFTQITTVTASVTTYKDTGLTASTTYYYRVRSNNPAGDSGYSNVTSAATPASQATGPVTSLHYTANANIVNGQYVPAKDGFNLADASSMSDVNSLPAGDNALVWLGMGDGVTSAFISAVQPFIG